MQRVLLTGATGFVGRHCLPRLTARGFEVHAVSSRSPAAQTPGVVWHRADLLDPEATRRLAATVEASHLLHLAWHTRPGDLYGSPRNRLWTEASLVLLDAAGEHGLARAAIAGSCAEYDWGPAATAGAMSEESTPLAPASAYGQAKVELAEAALAWGAAAGVSVVWPRIFFLYGPGERRERLVPAVVTALLAGEEARLTHGRQIRDYLYVEDAADAVVGLLAGGAVGPVNVASGRAVTLSELVTRAARRLDGVELLRFGARPAPADEPPRLVADISRLAAELDWSPTIDLDEGLARTIRWWREADG